MRMGCKRNGLFGVLAHPHWAETLEKEEVFGSVEAVKTVSDLFMPLSGEVVELNDELEDNPEIVNEDPYGKGWIIKISISDESEITKLLDAQDYQKVIDG